MHTLLLLLLFSFFLCAPQQVSSSKPFFTSNKNRRILNEPSFPPSQPPNQPPHPSSISSTINTKHPVSTTTTTPNQSPFFPFYSSPSLPPPPPPPPPSFSTFASFPANISSLVLPQSPKPKSSSSKLLPVTITTVACATVIITISAFVYCRRKRYVFAGNKTPSSENSISVFPPDTVTTNGTRKLRHTSTTTSSEFLYLGTVINSRGIEDVPDTRKMDSPELQPLPRLALQQHSPALASVVASSKQGNEEKEEFYSPRGSSLGYDGNGSGSPAIAAENFYEKSGELSSNVSIALSSRSMLSSPERNQVLLSSSPSLSPVHNHYVPSSKITYASSERDLVKNEDAFPRLSKTSLSPSSSAFSLPSSPEKAMHFGSLDQSPRISSFSDRFKQPGLSSLSLSPTLLSSPERELNESSNVDNVLDQFAAPPPSMPHWDIPLLSIPIGRGGNLGSAGWASPNKPVGLGGAGKILGRTKFGPARPCSTLRPDQAGSNGVSPLQPQLKHWEVPTLSTAVDQQVSRPPELIPPSRPFVMQNPTTKVFSHVELMQNSQNLGETENTLKPKLKPLHWDKVRASSDGGMVWDQLKSSSFKLNEEIIETLFVVKPKVNTPGSVLPQPNQEERVLDPKKSQNISILLRALNVTVEEVCEALLEGNADTLGTERLESLLKMAPSEEEERKLKEHKDDSPAKLGPAEKFLKAVLNVPFAFKRVEAMLYVVNFESEVEYLRKSFQTLEAACEELQNCRMFLKLLEAVLKTGNRMNVGTNRGDAQAFKLDTLLKLADVKGADGKTTLLHFVVQEIIRTEGVRLSGTNQTPSSTLNEDAKCRRLGLQLVSSLSSELANVKKAAAMDSEILSSDVSKLTKGIAYIAEVVKTNQMDGSDESSQKFTESMNKFIRMAEEEIPKIVAQERVALSLVKEITEYFHGKLAKEEAHPFRIFMVVRDFLTVLDRVCREVGMINERTMVSSAHKFPVPVNPMLPQPLPGSYGRQQYHSSDDDSASP